MVEIPTGCFDMGDHFAEGGSKEELYVHEVFISAFWMDVHEVTKAEYAECVAGGGCSLPLDGGSYSRDVYYGDPAYE
jgi:formylglycine-generating enzyme required for sulfatase activity